MDFEEVYPRIFVYKNVYDEIDKLFEYVKFMESNSTGEYIFEKWKDWFIFGTYGLVNVHGDDGEYMDDSELCRIEKYCYDTLKNATVKVVNHYMEYNQIEWPQNSFVTSPNIAKYFDEKELPAEHTNADKDNLRMQFHTDYPIGEWFWPGRKFLITANTYINDDYDGGEVVFLHGENIIPVKPKAGEIIVFPSGSPLYPKAPEGEPYFHAVNSPSGAEKYFTRSYIQYETTDTTIWDQKRSEFNSEEEWDSYIQSLVRGGHNTAAIYMGEPPEKKGKIVYMDKTMLEKFWISFRLDKYTVGEKFWISITPLAAELYDIDHKHHYIPRSEHCIPDSE